jgi:uncharacterized protein
MDYPDKRIISFIKKHHVLTLATVFENRPWCANCFYAWHNEELALVFTSDDHTRHITEAIANEHVAGSIVLETKIIGKIQGLQFEGELCKAPEGSDFRACYLKRFPSAVLSSTSIWVLRLTSIKFTDNRLGFGTKLTWKRNTL